MSNILYVQGTRNPPERAREQTSLV